jgi:hypothetical protein
MSAPYPGKINAVGADATHHIDSRAISRDIDAVAQSSVAKANAKARGDDLPALINNAKRKCRELRSLLYGIAELDPEATWSFAGFEYSFLGQAIKDLS